MSVGELVRRTGSKLTRNLGGGIILTCHRREKHEGTQRITTTACNTKQDKHLRNIEES
jgi:hypothetical protein